MRQKRATNNPRLAHLLHLRLPLWAADAEVNQCANEMPEQNHENPDDFRVALAWLLRGTVDQHPYPEHREEQSNSQQKHHKYKIGKTYSNSSRFRHVDNNHSFPNANSRPPLRLLLLQQIGVLRIGILIERNVIHRDDPDTRNDTARPYPHRLSKPLGDIRP